MSLLPTTGSKDDEPKIVCMRKSQWTSQHGSQNVKTHNRTTQTNYSIIWYVLTSHTF